MLTSKDKKFLGEVVALCFDKEISIKLPFTKSVNGCGGFFDETTFATATDKDTEEFLSVLVHEFSHVEQFLEKDPTWFSAFCKKHGDAIAWNYLDGCEDDNPWLVTKAFKTTIANELNCEKRALKNIQKYGLSIDQDKYTQKGNAYLYSYYFFRKNRCWYSKKSYSSKKSLEEYKKVINKMPVGYFDTVNSYWKKNAKVWEYLEKNNESILKKKYRKT